MGFNINKKTPPTVFSFDSSAANATTANTPQTTSTTRAIQSKNYNKLLFILLQLKKQSITTNK